MSVPSCPTPRRGPRVLAWVLSLLTTFLVMSLLADTSSSPRAPSDPLPPLETELVAGLMVPASEVNDADPFECADEVERERGVEGLAGSACAARSSCGGAHAAEVSAGAGALLRYAPKQDPPHSGFSVRQHPEASGGA